jgi:DNA-binding transcriptional MerR regulator
MYEEKGLLPRHEGLAKKLYSLEDIQQIAFVHYLASVKKINANGIRYILDIMIESMDETQKAAMLASVEKKLEAIPSADINEPETL